MLYAQLLNEMVVTIGHLNKVGSLGADLKDVKKSQLLLLYT